MLNLVIILLFGGSALFLMARYDLFDGKRWRSASEPGIAYVYVIFHLSLIVGAVVLFFYSG
jgi:hypothetical protein